MIDKVNMTIRVVLIMVVSIFAFGFVSHVQCVDTYADDSTIVAMGSITENATFTLESDGTLTIEGTGELNNLFSWNDYEANLRSHVEEVKKIIVLSGITVISDNSFYYNKSNRFVNLETVEFPATVTTVGNSVFGGGVRGSDSLKTVIFAEDSNLKSIGNDAFTKCEKLESINLPEGLISIGNGSFLNCKALTEITFPSTLQSFGNCPLGGCTNLKRITFNSMTAPTLDGKNQSGDYYALDGGGYPNVLNDEDGCLRAEKGNAVMRHPLNATGYSDTVEATAETGWVYYKDNNWEIFSTIPTEVQAVIDAINNIGAITEENYLNKESDITAAWEKYIALESDELKAQVTNFNALKAAQTAFDGFKLDAAKTSAKVDLDALLAGKTESDYDAEDWAALNTAINSGKAAIDAATTIDEVNTAKREAESAVLAIKTKEQKAAEELEGAKTSAKKDLDALLTGKIESDYDAEDWAALNAAINSGKAAIDAATTIDEVNTTKSAAESAVSAIKTKDQKKVDKIKKQRAAAKKYTVKGLKVKAKSRKFTVSWKKTAGATGYQVQYKLKSAKKYKTLKTLKKLKVTSKKFKKGKTYQFKVRTYTNVNGRKVYGKWSSIKTCKCK